MKNRNQEQTQECTISKKNMPNKICLVCKKIFYWRKKWKKDWKSVKYCSHKCSKKSKLFF